MSKIEYKKAAMLTLGCKVNQYETDAMQELLEQAGCEIVDFSQLADIYVINTCSVTNMADRKSRQMLHKAKKKNPDAVIVAVGCYVQAAKEELLNDGNVDLVIGNNKKKDIVPILEHFYEDRTASSECIEINETKEFESLTIDHVSEHTRAYIKVQDGCNQFCSYCIIPYTRGRVRSRAKEEVVEEVRRLAANGYKEIVLTGIHLSSYGIDLFQTSLLDLILTISEIDGITRIRLGSLEPRIITDEFASTLAKLDKVCPHFHLSLQSGCDETLKRMNRRYDTAEYKEKCNLLRKYFDRPALTTDIIVGFPGETDEEFEATCAYLEDINLYEMHIFKYSKRKGTRAEAMPNQISEPLKTERSARLLTMTRSHQQAYEQQFMDEMVEVLAEERMEESGMIYFIGHTKRYQRVAFATKDDLTNQEVMVKITGRFNATTLLAEL